MLNSIFPFFRRGIFLPYTAVSGKKIPVRKGLENWGTSLTPRYSVSALPCGTLAPRGFPTFAVRFAEPLLSLFMIGDFQRIRIPV